MSIADARTAKMNTTPSQASRTLHTNTVVAVALITLHLTRYLHATPSHRLSRIMNIRHVYTNRGSLPMAWTDECRASILIHTVFQAPSHVPQYRVWTVHIRQRQDPTRRAVSPKTHRFSLLMSMVPSINLSTPTMLDRDRRAAKTISEMSLQPRESCSQMYQ